MILSRRQALLTPAALAALAAGVAMPTRARAASPADRKFIFVFARGGWDPTRVFADGFDKRAVSMDEGAERGSVGGLAFVDHPDRPSVRSFFEANASRTVVLQGLLVRSIAHDICTRVSMTGTTSGSAPDWAAVIANSARDRYVLPHMVLAGPSFPGSLGVAVARTGSAGALTADYATSLAHARELKDLQWRMDFGAGGTLASQSAVAVDALSLGVTRCVTLQANGGATGWDTHARNDEQQSPLWEGLFAGLGQLQAMLEAAPGTTQPTLADETVVIVLSEMGRTPMLNAFLGKDHWPYTSAMVFGDGVVGGRNIGGWDENWYGRTVDPASGELCDDGAVLSSESLGATLFTLADLDPASVVSGVSAIEGMIA
ncbi:hypothetical protein LBMAG42_57100 [Deltaproteobacteria bacterium]|nr:hypothetical protein LBMAG42_57100 [Deltaproteobacteria bacterium]